MSLLSRVKKIVTAEAPKAIGMEVVSAPTVRWYERAAGYVVEGVVESIYPVVSRFKGYDRALGVRRRDGSIAHLPYSKGLAPIFEATFRGVFIRVEYDGQRSWKKKGKRPAGSMYLFTIHKESK